MEKTSSRKLTIVSLLVFVTLALSVLLVPGIVSGDDISYVGIVDHDQPGTCWMINPVDNLNEPQPVTQDFFIAPPGSSLPPDAPVDDIALLRCRTTFSEYTGPGVTFSGDNTYGCWAYYQYYVDDVLVQVGDLTSFWTQTVKAGGEATLTCHYRPNH